MSPRRSIPIVVISDVHLGTQACRAAELNAYLAGIAPERLILAGDIIDFWHIRKGYWPPEQLEVLRRVLKMAARGTEVSYVIGNHDAALRPYLGCVIGRVRIVERLELRLRSRRALVVHGDFFDGVRRMPRLVTKIGAYGYEMLISANVLWNRLRGRCGGDPVSLAALVKRSVGACGYVERFRLACADLAAAERMDMIICGHIHEPDDAVLHGASCVRYLNAGDWVEHCSALEYDGDDWQLVHVAGATEQGRRRSASTSDADLGWPAAAAAVIAAA